jgi:hypothetical protein
MTVEAKTERSFSTSPDEHLGQATSVLPLAETSSSNRWSQAVHAYS